MRSNRFQWVDCQLGMLRHYLPATIRCALDDLPRSLDGTYERILLGIEEERWDYAQRLFQCLAASIRPLRVDELAEILAMQFEVGALPSYDMKFRPENPEEAILSTCPGLLTILDVDGSRVVQFSHFSVMEYLTSERLAKAGKEISRYHILPRSAHSILLQASLSALLSLDNQVDKISMKNSPLAIYAAQHWVDHAQYENLSSTIGDAIELLFDPTKSHFATWVWIHDIDRPFQEAMSTDHPTPPRTVPLYYATLCGFQGLVGRLAITFPQDVNARGGDYVTPLHAAVGKEDLDMARLLLEHQADVNVLDDEPFIPLHWASRRGYRDFVELLLKHQADINAQDEYGQTPLTVASRHGQMDIVHLLLQSGAVVDTMDHNDRTPLMLASQDGQLDAVLLLLQNGAASDSRDDSGWTPLMFASASGHQGIARLLTQNGAAVDSQNDDGWTPLMLASEMGHMDVVHLLLQNGAAVDSRHDEGWTALMPASHHGHPAVVRLLIQNGAAVDPHDKDGRTPLTSASAAGYPDVAHFLLQNGAAVNSHDKHGWTPLKSASATGHLDVVRLLLRNGADVDSLQRSYSTYSTPYGGTWRFRCFIYHASVT